MLAHPSRNPGSATNHRAISHIEPFQAFDCEYGYLLIIDILERGDEEQGLWDHGEWANKTRQNSGGNEEAPANNSLRSNTGPRSPWTSSKPCYLPSGSFFLLCSKNWRVYKNACLRTTIMIPSYLKKREQKPGQQFMVCFLTCMWMILSSMHFWVDLNVDPIVLCLLKAAVITFHTMSKIYYIRKKKKWHHLINHSFPQGKDRKIFHYEANAM